MAKTPQPSEDRIVNVCDQIAIAEIIMDKSHPGNSGLILTEARKLLRNIALGCLGDPAKSRRQPLCLAHHRRDRRRWLAAFSDLRRWPGTHAICRPIRAPRSCSRRPPSRATRSIWARVSLIGVAEKSRRARRRRPLPCAAPFRGAAMPASPISPSGVCGSKPPIMSAASGESRPLTGAELLLGGAEAAALGGGSGRTLSSI